MKALQQAHHHDPLGPYPAERIRHDQLSRVVGKLDLSSEEVEAIERLSYVLVTRVLLDLVPEVMVRIRRRTSSEGCGEELAVPVGGVRRGERKRDGQVR